jgi:hypothetical protein
VSRAAQVAQALRDRDWQVRAQRMRLALVALAAESHNGTLLEEDGNDDELHELFALGYLATRRDYSDEYLTILTAEGENFVREQLRDWSEPL